MSNNYDVNKTFEQMNELQSRAMDSFQVLANVGTSNVETLARVNYAVFGDLVEFSLKQIKRPINVNSVQTLFSDQLAEVSELRDTLTKRGTEYVDLVKKMQADSRKAVEDAAAVVKAA